MSNNEHKHRTSREAKMSYRSLFLCKYKYNYNISFCGWSSTCIVLKFHCVSALSNSFVTHATMCSDCVCISVSVRHNERQVAYKTSKYRIGIRIGDFEILSIIHKSLVQFFVVSIEFHVKSYLKMTVWFQLTFHNIYDLNFPVLVYNSSDRHYNYNHKHESYVLLLVRAVTFFQPILSKNKAVWKL